MVPRAEKLFPRTAACLPEIFEFMEAFFRSAQVGEPFQAPAQLAVEELFTNLVKYSRGGAQDIRIEMSRDAGRLIVSLTDFDVEPFDIRTVPDAKTDLSLEERKPGGLGIHLVKRLVHRIDYEYAGRNSTTTFVKNLGVIGMLDIKFGERGEIVLSGRFDASQAERAEAFLAQVTESREMDLGGLQYISSLGLGVLLATQKRLMSSGHGLKLTNVRGHIREIFHFSGFEQVFEIEPAPPA